MSEKIFFNEILRIIEIIASESFHESARRGARRRWRLFSTDRGDFPVAEIRTRLSTGGAQTTSKEDTLWGTLFACSFERETGLELKVVPANPHRKEV